MAHDEESDDGPSIAPPSLGLGLRRWRRKATEQPTDPAPAAVDPVPAGSGPAQPPTVFDAPAHPVAASAEPVAEPPAAVVPVVVAPEPSHDESDTDVVVAAAAPDPAPTVFDAPDRPVTARPVTARPVTARAEPASEPEASVVPVVAVQAEPDTQPVTIPPQPPARPAVTDPPPEPAAHDAASLVPGFDDRSRPEPTATPAQTRQPRELRPPSWLVGWVAAALIGAVVGLVVVVLTTLGRAGCEVVRGTSSCGRGPGFLLLIAILAVAALVGATLLRLVRADGPTSTSLLAVGLLAVVVMIFLLDSIDSWWMVVAIPLAAAATYAGSWWATTAFTDVET